MKRKDILGGDMVVARSDGLLTTAVDGELMAMSVARGTCYGLNRVGTRVWELLAEPRSIDSLCAQLIREYDVDEAVCRSELVDLIEDLRDEQMVTIKAG